MSAAVEAPDLPPARYKCALEEISSLASDVLDVLVNYEGNDGPMGRMMELQIRHIGARADAALMPDKRADVVDRWLLPPTDA